jgi:hypothetical protein
VNHQVIEFHGLCIVNHEVHHLSPDARTSKLGLHVLALEHARTSHKSSGPGNAINHEEPGAADGHVIEEREVTKVVTAVNPVPLKELLLELPLAPPTLSLFIGAPLVPKGNKGGEVLVNSALDEGVARHSGHFSEGVTSRACTFQGAASRETAWTRYRQHFPH